MPPQHAVPEDCIPLFDPAAEQAVLGHQTSAAIHDVLHSGAFIHGPAVHQLETKLSAYIAARTPASIRSKPPSSDTRCIGVASGTDALHLALLALGVGAGDEVVVPTFTWISTAEVVPLVGATPVFVDVHPDTYCISTSTLRAALSVRTRAVIAVSLFGRAVDAAALAEEVRAAEEAFGTHIALVEDAAQSFGARSAAGWASCGCEHADVAITSFFPSKVLGAFGDGGAVFTKDAALAERVASMRVHGRDARTKLHVRVGMNSRLDTIQAAVLLAKMECFDDMLAKRVAVARAYTEAFKKDGRIVFPLMPDGDGVHVFGVYTIRVQKRDEVKARLQKMGIACAVYYAPCVHEQPVFRNLMIEKGVNAASLPVSEALSRQVLSLPMHAYLSNKDVNRVIACLGQVLDELNVVAKPGHVGISAKH